MSAAFPLARKTLRNRRALVLDYLHSRGVTQVRERIANSTHLMIEFFHEGRWHSTLISNSDHFAADKNAITEVRRILGPEPKEIQQRERKRVASKRKPAPLSTSASSGPRYRPRFRDEHNAMTRILRDHFAGKARSAPHTPA